MNLFPPAEVAKNYIATGKAKVNTPVSKGSGDQRAG